MKKTLLALILTLCVAAMVQAKPVSRDAAARVAAQALRKPVVDATPKQFTECYLFVGTDGKGFVLLAADDCVRPVLAYSPDGLFPTDHMPDHLQAWLDGYCREIAAVRQTGAAPSPKVLAQWDNPLPRKGGNSVEPMLTTTWGQNPVYNALCPYDTTAEDNAITGCIATAMAQIMRYWQYPATGWGSHSYTHSLYGTLSADFGATQYQWDLMPNSLNAESDSAQIIAVATLMYHAGVAVDMMYGPNGSGAFAQPHNSLGDPCAENALKTYFRYNPMLSCKAKGIFSDSVWDAMMRADLDASRPILYTGSDQSMGGHAFILDGYDEDGYFHINWGWRGYYNGYYTIDSLSPGLNTPEGPRFTFNLNNQAILNIYPAATPTDSIVTINIVCNDTTLGTVLGSGTYHLYDTVSIIPQAAEGCRYAGMASGYRHIPFSFLATQDLTDTILFERLTGDTVGYCTDRSNSLWSDDYGPTTEWGIRIPAVTREARQLTAVQFYCVTKGTYTLNIYQGDSINDNTPVHTQQFTLGDTIGWIHVELDSMLTFQRRLPVWITLSMTRDTLAWPAANCPYCGNPDGNWYHYPWGWRPNTTQNENLTWMLRAVFNHQTRLHVAASPNHFNFGDVTGMGNYYPGDTVVMIATPKARCQFVDWSNGSDANPLVFVITRDTVLIANFRNLDGIDEAESSDILVKTRGLELCIENPAQRHIEVYDIMGRPLSSLRTPLSTLTLPSAGVYMLKADGMPARRIIVTNR